MMIMALRHAARRGLSKTIMHLAEATTTYDRISLMEVDTNLIDLNDHSIYFYAF